MKDILNENWVFKDKTRKMLLTKTPRISYEPNYMKLSVQTYLHPNKGIMDRHSAKNIKCRYTQSGACPQMSNRNIYYSFQIKIHYLKWKLPCMPMKSVAPARYN